MKYILAVFASLFIFIMTGYAQSGILINYSNKIDTYLTTLEAAGFNGSVLVAKNNEILLSKGYGYRDIENQIKNTPSTIFDIGSITKQFTATAILKLEMEGKVSVSDRIFKYFDNLPADKVQITIHDLLRHQSGLISNVGKDFEKITEQEFLEKVFASELRFPVGTGFNYSNIGYSLLAMIIEKVSNQPYETYLYENLWKPCGMEMTGYTRPQFNESLIAIGYPFNSGEAWGKPTDKEWDTTAPYWHLKGNGGILSTTEDMYKWHKCLMTADVLSKEAKTKLYHPVLREGENPLSYYAYGWDVAHTNRNTIRVGHNGTNNIFYADFQRFLDEDIVLILMANKIHYSFADINMQISRIILDPKYMPEIPAADNDVNRNFTNQIIKTIEEKGLDSAKAVFDKRNESEKLMEFVMRNTGFDYIDSGRPEIAIQIFEMNVYAYPSSAKALQGLGEGYMETGKKELAVKYFKESLSINPDNPFVVEMVSRLED